MIKGVIFDLDGTLLYTLIDLNNALNYALKKNSIKTVTLNETKKFIGDGIDKLVYRCFKEENKNNFEQVLSDFKDYYIKHSCDFTKPYDGIIKMLEKLKQLNIKMAIVSNKYQEGVDQICVPMFSKYMNVFVGSRSNVKLKPDSSMVDIALKKLNLKNHECIYVGDSQVDILTAINANMKSVGVLWGYKDVSNADYIIDSPMEIFNIINKENKNG